MTWASPNAPLIEIGALTAEQPWMKSIASSSSIYSYVMNNYWHTNYKADQEGPVTFTYSILPHASFNAVDAAKFGTERRQPLVISLPDASTPPRSSFLHLSSPNVLVSSIKPIAGGQSWLVYVYNPTQKIQRLGFLWSDGSPASVRWSDAAGQIINSAHDFEIAAFDSAYVRVERASNKAKHR